MHLPKIYGNKEINEIDNPNNSLEEYQGLQTNYICMDIL